MNIRVRVRQESNTQREQETDETTLPVGGALTQVALATGQSELPAHTSKPSIQPPSPVGRDTSQAADQARLELPSDGTHIQPTGRYEVIWSTVEIGKGLDRAGDLAVATAIVLHRYTGAEQIPLTIVDASGRRTIELTITADTALTGIVDALGTSISEPAAKPQVMVAGDDSNPDEIQSCGAEVVTGIADDRAWLAYDPGVIGAAHARRMLGHIETVMAQLPGTDVPVAGIAILTEPEIAQFEAWNDTGRDYPYDTPFATAFEAQSVRTPDLIAIEDAEQTLTYRQLDRQANGAAHHLAAHGVGPGRTVGLLVDRAAAADIAIVAVFKAGGAYLPLDQGHPTPRMAAALTQGGPDILVVQRSLVAQARAAREQAGLDLELIVLEDLLAMAPHDAAPAVERSADDLAYLLPTSGSTGLPKVTMIPQRGLMNHAYAMIDALDLTEQDVIAQNAPLCFDISVWQLTTLLLVGGRVSFAPEEARSAPDHLLDWAAGRGVTVLQVVPSLMSSILQVAAHEADLRLHDTLRWIIPTGEALPPDTARRWLERFPVPPLVNAYGPAECSDDVTLDFIYDPPAADVLSLPIGRPVGNVTVHVLDARRARLPVGAVGEICVGGVGVGLGYRNDPDRTAAAFIDDPFNSGGRMYRTGDLGRFLEDGSVQYVGRVDHQVKVNGLRIELGEIETALLSYPTVRETVAAAVDGRLVAYVTTSDGTAPDRTAIRTYVAKRIPAYMTPDVIVHLDALPLNANGKVDRKALPAPTAADRSTTSHREPATPTEIALSRIWRELLNGEVGADDDFFELGGTSLTAAMMLWHVRKEFGADLPLSAPVQARRLGELAALIDESGSLDGKRADRGPTVVPLNPTGQRIPIFLAPGQGGSALGFLPLAGHLGAEQPVYGLDLQRRREEPAPPQTFASLVDYHIRAIRAVAPDGPYIVGGWCMGGEVGLEVARRLRAEGADVPLVVMLQTEHSSYPEYLQNSRISRIGRALWDRMVFELETLQAMPHSRRMAYFTQEILGKVTGKFTVPIEQLLAGLLDRFGKTWAGSERYHRKRWSVADGAAYEGFEIAPYDGDVLVVRAKSQPSGIVRDDSLGWAQVVTGHLDLAEVAGFHWNFLHEPQVKGVAAAVAARLDRINDQSAS